MRCRRGQRGARVPGRAKARLSATGAEGPREVPGSADTHEKRGRPAEQAVLQGRLPSTPDVATFRSTQ